MAAKKKLLMGCLSIPVLLLLALVVFYIMNNESRPIGKAGPEADQLALNMLEAVNKSAWDSLGVIQWRFANRHSYRYYKNEDRAIVEWDDFMVDLDLDQITGDAFYNGEPVTEDKQTLINKAWAHWCNDSFWLAAHYKVFDPGTKRSIVDVGSEGKGLLIEYEGGGVTPGDSYLWVLDDNNKPKYYKMWVSIIPLGGVKATWEDWLTLQGGGMVAQKHMLGPMNVSITQVQAAQSDAQLEPDLKLFKNEIEKM